MQATFDRSFWFSGIVAVGLVSIILAGVTASFKQKDVKTFLDTVQSPVPMVVQSRPQSVAPLVQGSVPMW